jgi:hypothetical protein
MIVKLTTENLKESGGTVMSIGSITDGQLIGRSGSSIVGSAPMDVVGGRLTLTDATHIRYAFVTNNQIRLYDGTGWRLRNLSAEITKLNTDQDVAATTLAVDKVYDVFALDTGSATSADVAFARWAIPSERFVTYASGTSYSKGDRVNVDNASYSSIWAQTLTSDASGDYQGFCFRTVFPGSAFSGAGEYIKITFSAHSSTHMVIGYASIGECDPSGNVVNAIGTAQFKQIKFSGNNGITINGGATAQSDALQFRIDPNKYYAVSIDFASGSTNLCKKKMSATGYNTYYVSGSKYNIQSTGGWSLSATEIEGVSDISVSAATYYVSVANTNQNNAVSDVTKWASLGNVPANYDFAGLYIQDGIPVLGPSNATLDGRKYRWLGVIYTYNNSTVVNFKQQKDLMYVSNFYNAVPIGVGVNNPYTTDTSTVPGTSWEGWNSSATDWLCKFISCISRELFITATTTLYVYNTGGDADSLMASSIGLNTATAPAPSATVARAYVYKGGEYLRHSITAVFRYKLAGYNSVIPIQVKVSGGAQNMLLASTARSSFEGVIDG